MKRYYLDALIESYIGVSANGGDVVCSDGKYTFRCMTEQYQTVFDEIRRLCEVQRSMGFPDYFARRLP